jgi:hypothetical protein
MRCPAEPSVTCRCFDLWWCGDRTEPVRRRPDVGRVAVPQLPLAQLGALSRMPSSRSDPPPIARARRRRSITPRTRRAARGARRSRARRSRARRTMRRGAPRAAAGRTVGRSAGACCCRSAAPDDGRLPGCPRLHHAEPRQVRGAVRPHRLDYPLLYRSARCRSAARRCLPRGRGVLRDPVEGGDWAMTRPPPGPVVRKPFRAPRRGRPVGTPGEARRRCLDHAPAAAGDGSVRGLSCGRPCG